MRWFAPGRAVALLAGAAAVAAAAALVATIVLAANGGSSSGDSGYSVTSFHADYRLQRDGDRTVLAVTETIGVDFYDAGKHGIYRSLPTTFNGYSTAVSDISVARNGRSEDDRVSQGSNAVTLRIGNAYSTVHGTNTYVIRYLYHDVVQDFGDHQEFYWNVNGVLWGVPMGQVSASLTVDDGLASALTGANACYYGSYGDTDRCLVTRSDLDGGVTFTTSGVKLARNQTQTLAVGFAPGTVAQHPLAPNVATSLYVIWGLAGGLALAALVLTIRAATRGRRAMGLDPGVVQFAPDDDLPPIVAAALVGDPGRGVLAELMRAASEGHVQLAGGGETSQPLTATLLSWPDDWQDSSQTALAAVFPGKHPDASVDVREALNGIGVFTTRELLDLAPRLGLVDFPDVRSRTVELIWGTVLAAPLIVTIGLFNAIPLPWWLPAAVLAIVALAVCYGLLMRWQTLTGKGAQAYRFLNGLRLFLATSEAERMRMVQGADTSERRGEANLVPIFEKLLPYAIALGVEDSWQKAVGTDLEPDVRFDWLPTGTGVTWQRLGWTSEPYSSDVRRYTYYDHSSQGTMGGVLGDWGTSIGNGVSDWLSSASTGSGGGRSGWSSGGGGWSSGGSQGGGFSGGGGGGGGGGSW